MTNYTHYNYLYYDPSREEYIYVGKATKHKRKKATRAKIHLRRSDKHPFTQRLQLMKKSGIQPDIILIDAVSNNAALACEIFWEAVIGCKRNGSGTLLNVKPCGEVGGAGARPQSVKDKITSALLKRGKEFYKNFSTTHKTAMQESNALQVTCPHCGKVGGRSPMHRWHFDKCRNKNGNN